jgi:kynurenine formamidase
MSRIRQLVTFAALVLVPGSAALAQSVDLSRARIVDLTHAFDEHTIYWPTSPSGFVMERLSYGETPGGWFYASNAICAPEHGGTHLDAPIHFFEGRRTVDSIPLEQLIAPAVMIDVAGRAAADPDLRLSAADVLAFEAHHGLIPTGAIVLLRTGWSERWRDRRAYLGDDTPGDASGLRFPSYGEDAARLLVDQRGVAALGVDVASIDYGRSADFIVHRVAAEKNVYGLENLTNLDQLPATGAILIALPMKIAGGSGGPVRVIALIPGD